MADISVAILPQNAVTLAMHVSERLSLSSPELTLQLLAHFCDQFSHGSPRQKLASLQYLGYWIKNLATFWDPVSSLHDMNATILRPAILNLIELEIREQEVRHRLSITAWI